MTTVHACDRRVYPLLEPLTYTAPAKASMLDVEPCDASLARRFIAAWHSRLPNTQAGPWMLAFVAHYRGTAYASALWHNPSARTLPHEWLELRRLAVAPDAPHCTASSVLGAMRRWIAKNRPEVPRLISYQDVDVHTGTIYRAAGWIASHVTMPRVRDRSKNRTGTTRSYRSSLNGLAPDVAGKVRWEVVP